MRKREKDLRTWYRFVLGDIPMPCESFVGMAEYLCDSRLEVCFLLELLALTESTEKLTQFYCIDHCYRGPLLGSEDCHQIPIRIEEPYMSANERSDCSVGGSSVGYVCTQVFDGKRKWDFGIWHGQDNGFGFENCTLALLVDIDGYGIHSRQREMDEVKLLECPYRACRAKEESFMTTREMAEAVLAASLWCPDGRDDEENAYLIGLRSRLVGNARFNNYITGRERTGKLNP